MRTTIFGGLSAVSIMVASASAMAAEPKHDHPHPRAEVEHFPRPGKPFSSAIRIGSNVYISGVIGTAADGSMPADFVTQATNTMDAVASKMKLAGATMDDVYKCTIALTNMDDWDAFNSVYVKYFKHDHFPVRMSFATPSLGGAAVEVQCEAHLPS